MEPQNLRRVLFAVRAGVAKSPKIQCTRMKLLTQPAILATFWIKSQFNVKLYEKCVHFYAKLSRCGIIFRTWGDLLSSRINDFFGSLQV